MPLPRRAVALFASFAVAIAPLAGVSAAEPLSRADYEACHARDDAQFRTAIEAITARALQAGLAKVDYRAIVGEEWRRGGLGEIVDKRVDLAVAEVRDETSWSKLLQSLAYKEKAQELATTVAERVYRSDAMKQAIEGLAVGVGKELGRTIEIATLDATEPALRCLRAFVGQRYGETVSRLVTADAGKALVVEPATGAAPVSPGAVLSEGAGGIAGAVLVVVRRQLANMGARLGQRLVGVVLGRLISVVAGGVGLVLIAKDIWDFRHGVLPIIAGEMKSDTTKDAVQDELAKTIGEQVGEHAREIVTSTTDRIIDIWREFQRAHAKVVDLAGRSEPFKAFLDLTTPAQLPRVDEVVALLLAEEGEAGVVARLKNGTLHEAVTAMPDAAMVIARETRSIEAGLGWTRVAGERARVEKVVELELHRRAKPADFTAQSLQRVIAVGDRLASQRLAAVPADARSVLLELEDKELKLLARGLTEDELTTLSRYLTGLERAASQRVLRAVAEVPARMQALASERVRSAIVASRDQSAAVGMMLRADGGFDPGGIVADLRLVADGKVSAVLVWERHPIVVAGGGVLALMLLLMMRRALFGRRLRQPAAAKG